MLVRDKLWLWGHPAGSHHGEAARHYRLPGESRIAPLEAAHYMGIPNVLMVTYPGFGPEPPLEQYALPLQSLDRVVWSIVGASGETGAASRDAVLKLAEGMPNTPGVIMDDFFHDPGHTDEAKRAALSLSDLRGIRERLKLTSRTLGLWVVLYDYQLDKPVSDCLGMCDVVTFWTWVPLSSADGAPLGIAVGLPTRSGLGPVSLPLDNHIRYHSTDTSAYRPTPLSLAGGGRDEKKPGDSWLFRLSPPLLRVRREPTLGPAQHLLGILPRRDEMTSNCLHFPALAPCLRMGT